MREVLLAACCTLLDTPRGAAANTTYTLSLVPSLYIYIYSFILYIYIAMYVCMYIQRWKEWIRHPNDFSHSMASTYSVLLTCRSLWSFLRGQIDGIFFFSILYIESCSADVFELCMYIYIRIYIYINIFICMIYDFEWIFIF